METSNMIKSNNTTLSAENFSEQNEYKLVDVDLITELPNEYPDEFNEFCSVAH